MAEDSKKMSGKKTMSEKSQMIWGAKVAYDAIVAYSRVTDHALSGVWLDAPSWAEDTVFKMVGSILAGDTLERYHAIWVSDQQAVGVVYGPRFIRNGDGSGANPYARPYYELSMEQQRGVHLHFTVMKTMLDAFGLLPRVLDYRVVDGRYVAVTDFQTAELIADFYPIDGSIREAEDAAIRFIKSEIALNRARWATENEVQAVDTRAESIAAAAILVDGQIWTLPIPARHHTIMHAWSEAHYRDGANAKLGEHEDGFVTSRGRFVDRKEAEKIAFAAGQVKNGKLIGGPLTSEDLW